MATVAKLNKSITEMDTEEATRLIWEVRDRRTTQKAISAKTRQTESLSIRRWQLKHASRIRDVGEDGFPA